MNLSPIGLFVKASPAPPKGSVIELTFHGVTEDDENIEVVGKVVLDLPIARRRHGR